MASDHSNSRYVGPIDPDRPELADKYRMAASGRGGGEGTVYPGWVVVDGPEVSRAIKVLHPDKRGDEFDAYKRNWELQKDIVNTFKEVPEIVQIFEVFEGRPPHFKGDAAASGRYLYMIMEWADGIPLSSWVPQNPKRVLDDVIEILQGIADPVWHLHHMHERPGGGGIGHPVYHGDLKPTNVMKGPEGVRLVDFGLARAAGKAPTHLGTKGFRAPEVARGEPCDARADVYSLGDIACYMLVGTTPPDPLDYENTEQLREATREHLNASPVVRDQSQLLQHLMIALEPDREQRASDIRAWAHEFGGKTESTPVVAEGGQGRDDGGVDGQSGSGDSGNGGGRGGDDQGGGEPGSSGGDQAGDGEGGGGARRRGPRRWRRLAAVAAVAAALALGGVVGALVAAGGSAPQTTGRRPDPATAPTTVPATTATTVAPVASLAPCPSAADASAAAGVSLTQISEPCGFARASSGATTATCPSSWICTWDTGDVVVVQPGAGQAGTVDAGTWRYIPAYPASDAVHDPCALYRKEASNTSERVELRSSSGAVQTCPTT